VEYIIIFIAQIIY